VKSKRELRRELIAARRAVPPDEVAAKSAAIADTLLESVNWAAIRTLHIYRSVDDWGEVRTGPLIARVHAAWPQIEVTSPTEAKDQPIPTASFDVIVVPVLGFDLDRYRLGLGGGFYDRFLAGQASAAKIGLSYDWAFVAEGLPREAHDIPLDEIVTDVRRLP
jgi:5-formyltetrahydrofolate cyclo-ligase